MTNESDLIDRILAEWRREVPTQDFSPLAVIGRIIHIAQRIERDADEALAPLGVTLWQLDVLSALRRAGPPHTLTPTQLLSSVILTSGAMTHRIDRLEARGLVTRRPDPVDRRGSLVTLTPKGRKLTSDATVVRLRHSRETLRALSADERKVLAGFLRLLLVSMDRKK